MLNEVMRDLSRLVEWPFDYFLVDSPDGLRRFLLLVAVLSIIGPLLIGPGPPPDPPPACRYYDGGGAFCD